ncbi:MAG: DUF456 domain-containing protein [Chloroflexota bacterium]
MTDWELFSQGSVLFLTLFVMMIGLMMTVAPPLPGTVIIWLAAIFYGLALGWDRLGWLSFSLLTLLMIVGIVVDFLAGHFGAKMGGASCLAITAGAILGFVLGIVASLIGTPILGCLAGLIGMVLGVLLIEWRRNHDWRIALNATKGYIAGNLAGIMAKVTSGFLMFGVFLVRVYWGG